MNKCIELKRIQEKWKGKFAIFGGGRIGSGMIFDFLKGNGFLIDCFFDNKIETGKNIVDGIVARNPEELAKDNERYFVFVCVSNKFQDEIIKQIVGYGVENYYSIDEEYLESFCKELKYCKEYWDAYAFLLDDGLVLKRLFEHHLGYELDLENPQTFNEKLQWLKIYNRKPIYTTMVDKYDVKKYVGSLIGEEYVIPSIGVWDDYDEIDFMGLPNKFVLKCTHDSGSVVICKNKDEFQKEIYRNRFRRALKSNYYYSCREWPYKNIKPRIMAERYIDDKNAEVLIVYKFFCFSGKPELVQVIQNDKTKSETIDYFDMEWNQLELRQNFPNSNNLPKCPLNWEVMKNLASVLSEEQPFIRIDFYNVGGKVYFSEFTFFSDAGFASFIPQEWDRILGDKIVLPKKEYVYYDYKEWV